MIALNIAAAPPPPPPEKKNEKIMLEVNTVLIAFDLHVKNLLFQNGKNFFPGAIFSRL